MLPVIAGAIRLDSPGPTLFRHPRLGLRGREIVLVKFRTMVAAAHEEFNPDGSRHVAQADARVTRVGRLLRGGIDELPQVLNVLRGELSFVGPRPDDLYASQLYRGSEWLKLGITPGITGLAAVSGRNDLPWHTRLLYDIYYVHHQTLWLDLRILAKTLAMALSLAEPGGLVSIEEVEEFARSDEARHQAAAIEAEVRKRLESRRFDVRYAVPGSHRRSS
jgi:lipopolysaccharide/colanic/teichoic acid biosynthesis glycosyltransferase